MRTLSVLGYHMLFRISSLVCNAALVITDPLSFNPSALSEEASLQPLLFSLLKSKPLLLLLKDTFLPLYLCEYLEVRGTEGEEV